ncbi:30S ribosomal protein S20 [Candidatus Saccharibacteria bacterium]|nr:30S ribosomal protein S20 [Candidatus Saccharibacteria bacterium]
MPIIKSAKKAARQAVKRTEHNQGIKKDIKAALKAFKTNPSVETLKKAQSEYDKAAKKDLLKKNTAARRKAKLYAIAKDAGVKLKTTKKSTRGVSKSAPRGTRSSETNRTKRTESEQRTK